MFFRNSLFILINLQLVYEIYRTPLGGYFWLAHAINCSVQNQTGTSDKCPYKCPGIFTFTLCKYKASGPIQVKVKRDKTKTNDVEIKFNYKLFKQEKIIVRVPAGSL